MRRFFYARLLGLSNALHSTDGPPKLHFHLLAALLCRLHQRLSFLDDEDRHHLDRVIPVRAFSMDRAVRYLERLADLVGFLGLAVDEIGKFTLGHVNQHRAWMRVATG